MILLAESGATRSKWALIDIHQTTISIALEGFNPSYHPKERLTGIIQEVLALIPQAAKVKSVCYYGAGCSGSQRALDVRQLLASFFTHAEVAVHGDLLASARGLFGNSPGIALILGTGSNAGIFDGQNLISTVPSLGYMIGDEGSGSHIGRLLVREFMMNRMPSGLSGKFEAFSGHSTETLIEAIYSHPSPGNFLASLAPFLSEVAPRSYADQIVSRSFNAFFKEMVNNLGPTTALMKLPMAAVGSVAYHFSEILRQTAEQYGFKLGRIVESPFEGLIDYHRLSLSE